MRLKKPKNNQIVEYEVCVVCGKLTEVPFFFPIQFRENYIAGCGQLCAKCAEKYHGGKNLKTNTEKE